MSRVGRWLTWTPGWWPTGWRAVPLTMAIAFVTGLATSFLLLGRSADWAVPMGAAVAVGAGIGSALRLWRGEPAPRPAYAPQPPPQRPD